MLDYSDVEKAAIGEGLDAIAKICDERRYHLPEEGEIQDNAGGSFPVYDCLRPGWKGI